MKIFEFDLHAYVDDALADDDRARFERRMAASEALARKVRALQELKRLVRVACLPAKPLGRSDAPD